MLGPVTFHVLRALGHRAVLSATATATYHHLSEPHEFELLLLDLQLGDQPSEPLILRLRAERFAVPKIVIFSALPMTELRRVARSIGANAFLQKPASVADINETIRRVAA